MKKGIVLLVFSLVFLSGKAQTGIGTTTPSPSAKLEVASTNQGFLPPRIALTATNAASPVTSPATGLLVYNTATTGTAPNNVAPGYYYWNGTAWIQIAPGLIIDTSKTAGFTLAATDNNKVFLITSATNSTVTVPSSLPVGFSCQLIQGGLGTITVTGSSVTLNSSNGFTTRATNSVKSVMRVPTQVR